MMKLDQMKVLDGVCEVLYDRDPAILMIALEIIYHFLYIGQKFIDRDGENHFILTLDSLGAINKIEDLQDFPSELVGKKVEKILTSFFDVE